MRKINEVLRLSLGLGLSERQVSKCCNVGRNTVKDYVIRAKKAGLGWPLPDKCDLESLLFGTQEGTVQRPLPAWEDIHREMKRKGVTLILLWEEYKETHPNGFQ